MADLDKEKEFDEAYNAYSADWSTLHSEMKRDLEIMLGDQWNPAMKSYLKGQRREALVFNKVRRIVKAITGYQRKNRLSMRLDPVEGSDEATGEILSSALMWNAQYCNGYNIISDAFEHGSLITGLNMLEVAVDYTDDLVHGDIKWLRHDYNSVLFDLTCRNRDMRDCEAVLNRTLVGADRLQQLLPNLKVSDLGAPNNTTTKFPYMTGTHRMRNNQSPYSYDRMWVRTATQHTVLIDKSNGQVAKWTGDDDRLREYFNMLGVTDEHVAVVKRAKVTVELRVYANGKHVWTGPDPVGLDDFPWVPFIGFWTPEAEKPELRIQGLIRCDRDPQDEVNKRRSKMLDIIDSQINSGWITKNSAVKNKEQLYLSGQGQVIYTEDSADPIDAQIKRIAPSDIPQGLFTLTALMDQDVVEIPGMAKEMLAMPDTQDVEVSAILAKLRQQAGLTVLADLFDNLELSQKILGGKTLRAMQKNYGASKFQRITGKPPTKNLLDQSFGKYDVVCVEGLLTDTQKQHFYAQLMAMRKMGMTEIPTSAIIAAWPLEGKSELIKQIQAQEQAKAKMDEENQKLNQQQTMMNQSMMQANIAKAQERMTQAQENRTSATYDRIKTLKDLQSIDLSNLETLVRVLAALKTQTEPGQGAPANPTMGAMQ